VRVTRAGLLPGFPAESTLASGARSAHGGRWVRGRASARVRGALGLGCAAWASPVSMSVLAAVNMIGRPAADAWLVSPLQRWTSSSKTGSRHHGALPRGPGRMFELKRCYDFHRMLICRYVVCQVEKLNIWTESSRKLLTCILWTSQEASQAVRSSRSGEEPDMSNRVPGVRAPRRSLTCGPPSESLGGSAAGAGGRS